LSRSDNACDGFERGLSGGVRAITSNRYRSASKVVHGRVAQILIAGFTEEPAAEHEVTRAPKALKVAWFAADKQAETTPSRALPYTRAEPRKRTTAR
jgi:hypothetical protein